MRRFAIHPDYMQSVPTKNRAKARDSAKSMQTSASADKPAKGPLITRKHYARMLGAATLATLLSFALIASPGENPENHTRVSADEKPLAKGLKNMHNPVHALPQANGKKRNERIKARGIVRKAGSDRVA